MGRSKLCLSPKRRPSVGRDFLVSCSFSALKPSLSHPIPRGLASGISGGRGHLLAFGGVFQKLVSRIDRCHRRSLLGFPVLLDTIECRIRRAQPPLDTVKRAGSCSGNLLHPAGPLGSHRCGRCTTRRRTRCSRGCPRRHRGQLALPLRPLTGLAQVQEPGGARCEARRSTLPAAARRRWTTPRPSSRRAGSNGRRGAKMEEVE